jgi:hypothetical protein
VRTDKEQALALFPVKKRVYGYILTNTVEQLVGCSDRYVIRSVSDFPDIHLADHAEETDIPHLNCTASLRLLLLA